MVLEALFFPSVPPLEYARGPPPPTSTRDGNSISGKSIKEKCDDQKKYPCGRTFEDASAIVDAHSKMRPRLWTHIRRCVRMDTFFNRRTKIPEIESSKRDFGADPMQIFVSKISKNF